MSYVAYIVLAMGGNYILGLWLASHLHLIPRKWPMGQRLLALIIYILIMLVIGISWSTKWEEWLL